MNSFLEEKNNEVVLLYMFINHYGGTNGEQEKREKMFSKKNVTRDKKDSTDQNWESSVIWQTQPS